MSATCGTQAPLAREGSQQSLLGTLTKRERQVASALIRGLTNKRIAEELGISFRTVEIHRARLMRKLAAPTLAALLATILPLQGDMETGSF